MTNPINTIMQYLASRQTRGIRSIHIGILLLVISQIILSNFMHIDRSGQISQTPLIFYATWAHIILGLFTLFLALAFVIIELNSHGLRYFYPYLYGDFSQLKADLATLKTLKLPEPNPYGLATIVQGLGLGAITLVLLSGAIWFYAWFNHFGWSGQAREIHESLTGLIEAYIIGHGGLGLIHIFFSSKPTADF